MNSTGKFVLKKTIRPIASILRLVFIQQHLTLTGLVDAVMCLKYHD